MKVKWGQRLKNVWYNARMAVYFKCQISITCTKSWSSDLRNKVLKGACLKLDTNEWIRFG